eukprot:880637-Pyramimonas_sp.AAC.1
MPENNTFYLVCVCSPSHHGKLPQQTRSPRKRQIQNKIVKGYAYLRSAMPSRQIDRGSKLRKSAAFLLVALGIYTCINGFRSTWTHDSKPPDTYEAPEKDERPGANIEPAQTSFGSHTSVKIFTVVGGVQASKLLELYIASLRCVNHTLLNQLTVFNLDRHAQKSCSRIHQQAQCALVSDVVPSESMLQKYKHESTRNRVIFLTILWYKTTLIVDFMHKNPDTAVLFADVDSVFLGDPTELILSLIHI